MSPFSAPVLLSGAILGSPVVWQAMHHALTVDEALQRGGIVLTVVWVALSAARQLLPTAPPAAPPADDVRAGTADAEAH